MSIRSGIIVAIRCLMVVLAFNALLGMLTVAASAHVVAAARLSSIAIVGLVFIPLLLIYWSAGWIVDVMTPGAEEVRPETKIGVGDVQAVAFSAVGAFVLFTAVRETIGLLSVLPRLSMSDEAYIVQDALRAAAAWIIGLYLLIGAPQIRRWIGSMRRVGPSLD